MVLWGSYPTYEEWKRDEFEKFLEEFKGSYPTYEEWKLQASFTLPLTSYRFLSYLWGMETEIDIVIFLTSSWFLSYLWGMETHSPFLYL